MYIFTTADRRVGADAGSASASVKGSPVKRDLEKGLFSFLAGGAPDEDHIPVNRQFRGLRQVHQSTHNYFRLPLKCSV